MWYRMPTGREAERLAHFRELDRALAAAHCGAQLIMLSGDTVRDRLLARSVLAQTESAREVLRKLQPQNTTASPSG